MNRMMRVAIREVLDKIAEQDEQGTLRPEAIVEAARDPKSPLHRCFTWNDEDAAYAWQLHEARVLIRTYKVVIDQAPIPIKTRAYVSLKSARVAGTGYTPIRRVLSEPELHAELLRNALEDLEGMERRYGHLRELKPIFTALRRVRRRVPREHRVAPRATA